MGMPKVEGWKWGKESGRKLGGKGVKEDIQGK